MVINPANLLVEAGRVYDENRGAVKDGSSRTSREFR